LYFIWQLLLWYLFGCHLLSLRRVGSDVVGRGYDQLIEERRYNQLIEERGYNHLIEEHGYNQLIEEE